MNESDRLLTLDAMRGIAALCVMVTHVNVPGTPHLVASGYLAVDFFFLLSGLVIARTYEGRLNGGMGFARFAAIRAIRIYPLYLIGFALGLVRCIGLMTLHRPDALTPTELASSLLLEPWLLPSPWNHGLFEIDGPAWSLFFELAINAVYALVLVRCGTRVLVGVAVAFGVLLVYVAASHGSLNSGQSWETFHGGVARVGFSFTVGIVFARLAWLRARASRLALVPMVLLVLLLNVPAAGEGRIAYDLFAVLLAAPLLVGLGARFGPTTRWQGLSRLLGELSYPVYVIHYPLLWLLGFAAKRVGLPSAVWIALFFATAIGGAWLLNRWWDVPVRRRLSSWLLGGAGATRHPAAQRSTPQQTPQQP